MLTETQDRDAIVSKAVKIDSSAVRAEYIAGACGYDPALRKQVEELVAAHFQAGGSQKESTNTMDDNQPEMTTQPVEVQKMGQKKPRGMMSLWALLLVPATVGGAGLTAWTLRAEEGAQKSVQQLREERDQARKAEALAREQLAKAVAARHDLEKERDQALAEEKGLRRADQTSKAVLTFFQDKLLCCTGNPKSWSGVGLRKDGKDVTLRQAVDAAEAKVAGTFADQPLVEASIRAILGATYLDLDEADRAVKEYEQALALREAELGPDDPATGECRNQLAIAYRRAGRHDDASRLFDLHKQNNKGNNIKQKPNSARGQSMSPRSIEALWEDS